MKHNYLIFAAILCLFTTFQLQSQTFKNASEYLDFVGQEQENITKSMWRYTKAMAHSKNDRSIDAKRKALINTVEKAIDKIEKAEGFDGDVFKGQILDYLRLNESLLKQDYAKIIDLKEIAEQSYDLMEAYVMAEEMANKKMSEAYTEFDQHFHAFAAKNNINIVENESDLGRKMKISNAVFKHYNQLHLIHFKVSINEVYLIDAQNKGDISAIQQNTNALASAAREGLEILKTVELYDSDASVVESIENAFNFYLDEAENKMPIIIDFLLMNADFETIQETLEKTPEKKRTKEQVDTYNKKVKDINKEVKNYNKTNEALNKERQKIIENINEVQAKFLARHIPND